MFSGMEAVMGNVAPAIMTDYTLCPAQPLKDHGLHHTHTLVTVQLGMEAKYDEYSSIDFNLIKHRTVEQSTVERVRV